MIRGTFLFYFLFHSAEIVRGKECKYVVGQVIKKRT